MTSTQERFATRRVDSPHLRALESEAIHILRDVAGQCDKPVILVSAGKDSVLVLVPVIAPYADARDKVRAHHAERGTPLLQVHLSTPVEVCADRDVKGLYAKAFRGEISSMTGVDDPYEVPDDPDLRIDTSAVDQQSSVGLLLNLLTSRGLV